MLHICVSQLGLHWFRLWLVPCSAPCNNLNQCWLIVNWTPGNKFQWNSNLNSDIFIHENAFEIAVCRNGGHLVQGEMSYEQSYVPIPLAMQYHSISTWVCCKDLCLSHLLTFAPHWGDIFHTLYISDKQKCFLMRCATTIEDCWKYFDKRQVCFVTSKQSYPI